MKLQPERSASAWRKYIRKTLIEMDTNNRFALLQDGNYYDKEKNRIVSADGSIVCTEKIYIEDEMVNYPLDEKCEECEGLGYLTIVTGYAVSGHQECYDCKGTGEINNEEYFTKWKN